MFTTKTTTQTTSTIRIALAMALATTLIACEANSPPTTKARPPVTEATPTPEATPPVAVTPPPAVTPEAPTKVEPIVVKAGDDTKPVGTLAGARKMLDDGQVGEAFDLASLAVRETPKRSAAWNTLGRVQLRMGKRKDAIASFEQAVELNPRNSYAHNNLGLALIYDQRYEDAVEALEEAVELEPVTAYMWNNLGMAYEQLDRLEDARDAYGKAAEMDSQRARESIARLKGVESVIRTAKVEPDLKVLPGTDADKTDKTDTEKPTVTQ
jgi:Tfp pilus assembly protein PilF